MSVAQVSSNRLHFREFGHGAGLYMSLARLRAGAQSSFGPVSTADYQIADRRQFGGTDSRHFCQLVDGLE